MAIDLGDGLHLALEALDEGRRLLALEELQEAAVIVAEHAGDAPGGVRLLGALDEAEQGRRVHGVGSGAQIGEADHPGRLRRRAL